MRFNRIFLMLIASVMLFACGAENNTSTKASPQGYEVRLQGDWLNDAVVVDSNNQMAAYKGKGVYLFKQKPQGEITLTGGTFANSGAPNKMVMKIDAKSNTLSPLNSFFYAYPQLQDNVLTALKNSGSGNNAAALANTSKLVYIMASHNLLDPFSRSLHQAKSYGDIFRSARSTALLGSSSTIIDTYLLAMLTLSFFDIADNTQVGKINIAAQTSNKRYVTQNGAGTENGNSWQNAYAGKRLQHAINEMDSNKGTVWVAQGIYKPHLTDASVSFMLKNGVKLYGGFKGDEVVLSQRNLSAYRTIISGDIDNNDTYKVAGVTKSYKHIQGTNTSTLLKLINSDINDADASTLLDGFYITGGYSTNAAFAGGLSLMKAKITLKNSHFYGNINTASPGSPNPLNLSGGAIRSRESSLTVKNTRFTANSAEYGAGISSKNSTLHIEGATFTNNTADYGGALSASWDKASKIINSTFKNNVAKQKGGAIYNIARNYRIENAAFRGNHAMLQGGAIFINGDSYPSNLNSTSPCQLTGVTFYSNTTSGSKSGSTSNPGKGGALYLENQARPIISNTTFAYNTSFTINGGETQGGAIYNSSSSPRLINTTFYQNHADNGAVMFTTGPFEFTSPTTLYYERPLLVNSILWDNWDNKTPSYHQYRQTNSNDPHQNKRVIHADNSFVPSSTGLTDPNFIEKNKVIRGVPHTYYELGSNLGSARSVGAASIATNYGNSRDDIFDIVIPNKDQLGNSRPSNSVYKGAVQALNTSATPSAPRPFIKTVKIPSTGSLIIELKFSAEMDKTSVSASTLILRNAAGQIINANNMQWDTYSTKLYAEFPLTTSSPVSPSASWYRLTVTTDIKNSNATHLNREYVYDFQATP